MSEDGLVPSLTCVVLGAFLAILGKLFVRLLQILAASWRSGQICCNNITISGIGFSWGTFSATCKLTSKTDAEIHLLRGNKQPRFGKLC